MPKAGASSRCAASPRRSPRCPERAVRPDADRAVALYWATFVFTIPQIILYAYLGAIGKAALLGESGGVQSRRHDRRRADVPRRRAADHAAGAREHAGVGAAGVCQGRCPALLSASPHTSPAKYPAPGCRRRSPCSASSASAFSCASASTSVMRSRGMKQTLVSSATTISPGSTRTPPIWIVAVDLDRLQPPLAGDRRDLGRPDRIVDPARVARRRARRRTRSRRPRPGACRSAPRCRPCSTCRRRRRSPARRRASRGYAPRTRPCGSPCGARLRAGRCAAARCAP